MNGHNSRPLSFINLQALTSLFYCSEVMAFQGTGCISVLIISVRNTLSSFLLVKKQQRQTLGSLVNLLDVELLILMDILVF